MGQKDLSKLSDDDLMKIVSMDAPKPKDDKKSLAANLSDDELYSIATSDIREGIDESNKMSKAGAARAGIEQFLGLGFAPAAAGLGAGLGSVSGEFEKKINGEGLADRLRRSIKSFSPAYDEGRKERIALEDQALVDQPGAFRAGNAVGMIATLPATAVRTAKGAIGLGALMGAGNAASTAESAEEAAAKTIEGAGIGLAAQGLSRGLEMAAPAIKKGLGKATSWIGDKVSKGAVKAGSALTGVAEQDIKTFAKNADEIAQMAKSTDSNVAEAADQIRQKFSNSINKTRDSLNNQISSALKQSTNSVDAEPILKAIESQKSKLNPKLYQKEISQIDDLMNSVKSLSKDGKISSSEAHELKQYLQDRASSAYRNSADPASLGTEAAKAAKGGAAIARKLINTVEPEVAAANNQLAKIHAITDKMNMNLLNMGKPESALLAAGSGGNVRNAKALTELGKITNSDMIGEAQKLSAMRTFGNPQLLPIDTTGKAVARMATGGGIGTLMGGPLGAAVGSAMTSPAALKAAIVSGKVSKRVLEKMLNRPIEMTQAGLTSALNSLSPAQLNAALTQSLATDNNRSDAINRRLERLSNDNSGQ